MFITGIGIITWVNSYHKSKRDRPIKWNSLIQFYHTYAIIRGRSWPVSVSSEPLGYCYSLFPIFNHKYILLFVGRSVSQSVKPCHFPGTGYIIILCDYSQ